MLLLRTLIKVTELFDTFMNQKSWKWINWMMIHSVDSIHSKLVNFLLKPNYYKHLKSSISNTIIIAVDILINVAIYITALQVSLLRSTAYSPCTLRILHQALTLLPGQGCQGAPLDLDDLLYLSDPLRPMILVHPGWEMKRNTTLSAEQHYLVTTF